MMNGPHLRYLQLLPLLQVSPCLCNVDFKAFIINCLIIDYYLISNAV